jgi:long-chain acyl-CoA synthetase
MFASAAQAFELTPHDILLPGSSCWHIGGFGFSFSALAAGARVVVARGFDHDEIGPLLRTTRPTLLSMLPTALLHLIREHDMTVADFGSLRLCRSGGDKVPAELEKELIGLTGRPLSEGYGMTEIGLAALNPPSGVDKPGSIGLPSPGFVFSTAGGGNFLRGRKDASGSERRRRAPAIGTTRRPAARSSTTAGSIPATS